MGSKVFDLQLLLGRENIMGDKPKICIESIETCGRNLYIGTNDCFIYHYLMYGQDVSNGPHISVERQSQKHLGMRKSVTQIKAALPLNNLLVNCDSNLLLLSMLNLSVSTAVSGKIKNIRKFCVNERPTRQNPFSIEICVSFVKKKTLQIFQIHEDQVIPMHEVGLPGSPYNMAIDGKTICVSTESLYMLLDFETAHRQELFTFEENGKLRLVTCVGPSEFLVSATGSLGMFVHPDGTSNRPPVQWSEGVFAAGVLQPFIIALNDEFITVHSMLDQQQKQSFPFQGGILLQNCEGGSLIISTPKDVFVMIPIPLEQQLNSLLKEGQVDEAMSLIHASKRKIRKEKYNILLSRVLCMSGFVRFQECNFDGALQMFLDGQMDPRELVCLYEELLPHTTKFKRTVPPLHDICSVTQMCDSDKAQILECKEFLSLYLNIICNELKTYDKNPKNAPKFLLKVDAAYHSDVMSDILYSTIALLSQLQRNEDLAIFVLSITSPSPLMDKLQLDTMSDLVIVLKRNDCFHAAALLLAQSGELEEAMGIWRSIELKEVNDNTFPGLKFVAQQVAEKCKDAQSLWRHAEWILKLDQSAGLQIFCNPDVAAIDSLGQQLDSDDVISFLHQFPEALMDYLYYLVIVCETQKEKYHTHLAVLSLEVVLSIQSKEPKDMLALLSARKKLQHILQVSDIYRVHILLGKVEEAQLFDELVILHSKLGEHEKALEILVHKSNDSFSPKEYCFKVGSGDKQFLQQMLQMLLSVYLQDMSATRGNIGSTVAVVDLLNAHSENFDPEKVLHLLPSHWSVAMLGNYLHNSLRKPLHDTRSELVQCMLAKCEVLCLQRQKKLLHATPVFMNEGKICRACNRIISDGPFAKYPNGLLVHIHCAKNKYVCPVTGKVFKTLKRPTKVNEHPTNDSFAPV